MGGKSVQQFVVRVRSLGIPGCTHLHGERGRMVHAGAAHPGPISPDRWAGEVQNSCLCTTNDAAGCELIGQAWFFSRIVTFRLSEAVRVSLLSATRATGARAPAARKAVVSTNVASGRDMFEASGVVFVTASAIVEMEVNGGGRN